MTGDDPHPPRVVAGIRPGACRYGSLCRRWLCDERGAAAIEYALIAVGVALSVTVAFFSFGGELETFFGTLAENLAP